jgi:hypothetical protein
LTAFQNNLAIVPEFLNQEPLPPLSEKIPQKKDPLQSTEAGLDASRESQNKAGFTLSQREVNHQ